MTTVKNEIYKSMRIGRLEEYQKSSVINAISSFEYGLFVWDYTSNICYVNDFMIDRFSIDIKSIYVLQDYLATKIDDNSLFRFLSRIYEIKLDNEVKRLEFPVKSRKSLNWYGLELTYVENDNVTIGLISQVSASSKTSSVQNIDNMYHKILSNIDMHVAVTSEHHDILFINFESLINSKEFYTEIEEWLKKPYQTFKYKKIQSIQSLEKSNSHNRLLVTYNVKNTLREEYIVRKQILSQNDSLTIYTHNNAIESSTEQIRLQKIIRANDLMMETKDIVDHIDDLNEMFNYMLSKIQTVIPEVSRCCILRLNKKEELFLDSSYGFNEDYVEEFALPFKKSFAYMHMQNDFSKSVIINDIQRKYSDLFPDIKGDNTRFTIESNITTPLVINNVLYGLISVDSDNNRVFDDVDTNLLDYIKIQTERAIDKYQTIRNIKKDSTIDSLTGIGNRRQLTKVLDTYKNKADNQKKSFHFVAFDLDGLKLINDTYGHNCGDQALKQFSFVINSNIRETDFIARIGGDEFVGLFYDIDMQTLQNRLESWQTYFMNNPIEFKGDIINIGFSYGIAEYKKDGLYFSELMEQADKELYQQKRRKKAFINMTQKT